MTADTPFVVVAQWPLKSIGGTKRDAWLRDHAEEWISATLAERDLGVVDGWDQGARSGDAGGFVMNVFAFVTDGPRGATAVAAAVRAGGADATRVEIAWRAVEDDDWTVTHRRRSAKLPGPFAV